MTQRVSSPAVTVHALAQAEAALAAAGTAGVTLLSAPGAAGFLGPSWFLAMTARPAPVPAEASAAAPSEGVDPAAVAALAARLDETIARLRGVLGEEV